MCGSYGMGRHFLNFMGIWLENWPLNTEVIPISSQKSRPIHIRGGPFLRTGFSILEWKGISGPHPPTPKSFHNAKIKPAHQLTQRNWYTCITFYLKVCMSLTIFLVQHFCIEASFFFTKIDWFLSGRVLPCLQFFHALCAEPSTHPNAFFERIGKLVRKNGPPLTGPSKDEI